jgi:hypothetical protein
MLTARHVPTLLDETTVVDVGTWMMACVQFLLALRLSLSLSFFLRIKRS